jgi:ABC-type phosphate transport system substrate-binding protein
MRSSGIPILIFVVAIVTNVWSQDAQRERQENALTDLDPPLVSRHVNQSNTVVRMTGVRFAYPLVEQWIDRYSKLNPEVQIIIEWRGSQDPKEYDILVEAYEHPEDISNEREYVYFARYAILPVANSKSDFAKIYGSKGLTTQTIKQVFFHDIFSDKTREQKIAASFTTYTRLQKAGAPIVFAKYFKYEQKDLKGKGIAGSDDHLVKAVLRDSTGVAFLPMPVIYTRSTGTPVAGLSVLPVDLNDNGRISDDEKFYDGRASVIQRLSDAGPKGVFNVPIGYLHFSVDKKTANKEALSFIRWVIDNGLADLKDFGFLLPETSRLQVDKFAEFVSMQGDNGKP